MTTLKLYDDCFEPGRWRATGARCVWQSGMALGVAAWLASVASLAPAAEADQRDEATVVEPVTDAGPARSGVELLLGGQYFWVAGKSLPGVSVQVGRGLFAADFESTLMWLTAPSSELELSFVGVALGASLMLVPLRTEHVRLSAGLGGDFYLPWRIHPDESHAALAVKVAVHGWLTPSLGISATARAYPLHDRGLELGVARDGSQGLPVLFTTGIAWRLQ